MLQLKLPELVQPDLPATELKPPGNEPESLVNLATTLANLEVGLQEARWLVSRVQDDGQEAIRRAEQAEAENRRLKAELDEMRQNVCRLPALVRRWFKL